MHPYPTFRIINRGIIEGRRLLPGDLVVVEVEVDQDQDLVRRIRDMLPLV